MSEAKPAEATSAEAKKPFHRRHRKKLVFLAFLILAPLVFHFVAVIASRVTPPPLGPPGESATERDGIRWLGASYVRKRGNVWEARLVGTPEQIGHAHAKLFYAEMVESEGQLYGQFERFVPIPPVRTLLVDIAKLKYRGIDLGIAEDRRVEMAAQARAFSPDPFEGYIPTYQRLLYLQSLYDISLSFEHSPMLGCTSFFAEPPATADGQVILARNFDFEAGPTYDLGKAVFLIEEAGKIPYASVAWPGFVGSVSGMNQKGVAIVIHGGRAREPSTTGEPVVHTVRRVLAEAESVDQAIEIVRAKKPMVSHILFVADASGNVAVIERAPGEEPFIRRPDGDEVGLTNHFEGPFRTDQRNLDIEKKTSTHARRTRIDELLASDAPIGVDTAVAMLRDKRGSGGGEIALGNRAAVDALIATHAVVMETTHKSLWVSEGPHLMGRFVRFDLEALFAPGFSPEAGDALETMPEDPLYRDGTYEGWKARGEPHTGAE